MKVSQFLSGALLAGAAQAQVGAYGQCGGYEWTGLTTCVSGYYVRTYFLLNTHLESRDFRDIFPEFDLTFQDMFSELGFFEGLSMKY